MDSQKQEVAERIKQSNNILVTVSSNPSVDQLAACIGLTLALNKMGKHATAVFSGAVPSTIEFLQPEKTIEKNTDSLRDFIIALDKSKADKLRYKVEDKVVKIFITPYKTSISDKDLEFSQGDFNVDVVVALGVHDQADLDQAITAHGRILHDATVMTVNLRPGGELGSINWLVPTASSLSELATTLIDMLDKRLMDNQIATAFLTGIVAETERFSNEKTSPQTMSISAALMAAGANQQLVATKLEEPPTPPPPAPDSALAAQPAGEPKAPATEKKSEDGTLEITHDDKDKTSEETKPEADEEQSEKPAEAPEKEPESKKPEPAPTSKDDGPAPTEDPDTDTPKIHIDENGSIQSLGKPKEKEAERPMSHQRDGSPHLILNPPTFDKPMSADAMPGGLPQESSMTLPQVEPSGPLLSREPLQRPSVAPTIMPPNEGPKDEPAPAAPTPPMPGSDTSSLPNFEPTASTTPPTPSASAASVPPMPAPTPPAPEPTFTLPPAAPTPTLTPPTHPSYMTAPPSSQPQTDTPSPEDDERPSSAPPTDAANLSSARDAVDQAISSSPASNQLEPIAALNAQSLGGPLHNVGVNPPAGEPSSSFNLPGTTGLTDQAMPAVPPASDASSGYVGSELPQPSLNPLPASPAPNTVGDGHIPIVPPISSDDNLNGGLPSSDPVGPGAPPPVPPPMLPPTQP
jgi:hypothetical protein